MRRTWIALLAAGVLGAAAPLRPPTWEVDLAPEGEPGVPFVRPDTGDGFRCSWDLPLDRSTRLDSQPKAFEQQPR